MRRLYFTSKTMYKFEDLSKYIDDPYGVDVALNTPTPGEAVDIRRRILQYEEELPRLEVEEIMYVPWTIADFTNSGHYVRVSKTISEANQVYRETDLERYSQTVNDMRMGTVGREVCATCGRSSVNCIGHMGYIELKKEIIHPLYFRTLIRILRCVQMDPPPSGHIAGKGGLGKLLVSPLRLENELRNLRGMQRLKALEQISKNMISGKGQTSYNEFQNRRDLKTKWSNDLPGIIRYTVSGSKTEIIMDIDELKTILAAIRPDDAVQLGLVPGLLPSDFLIKFIPVVPNTVRPPVYRDGKQENNELTQIYDTIVDLNNRYDNSSNKQKILSDIFMKYHDIIYGKKDTTAGKKKTSMTERIKGKHGFIRENLEASRVNFGARSVVTPNPKLSFDQVSLPKEFRSKLTRTIWVDENNYQEIQELINKGQVTHLFRGERTIPLSLEEKPQVQIGDKVYRWLQEGDYVLINRNPSIHKTSFLGLRVTFNPGKTIQINLPTTVPLNADFDGDELNVHVIQSDLGYAEVEELMCINKHIIDYQNNRVLTGLSYDYLVSAYMLTSPETYVSRQLYNSCLSEIENNPGLFTLQERLIKHNIIITAPKRPKSQLLDLIMEKELTHSPEFLEILKSKQTDLIAKKLNIEDIGQLLENNDEELWEYLQWLQSEENWQALIEYPGKALFSALLPEDFQYRKGSVIIKDGILTEGIISKSDIGSTANNIIQQLVVNYGEEIASQFMTNSMHMLGRWFDSVGFSIGVDDCYVMDEAERSKLINSELQRIEQEIAKLGPPPRTSAENRLYENKITEIIGGADRAWNRMLKEIISRRLNMMEIARISGAKGSELNITNISLALGQQKHYGQRIGFSLTQQTRCLPYFSPNDISPASRGYCVSSFAKGLTPYEFMVHAVTSREGLLDTSSNTPDTGDLHRRTTKLMYNIMIFPDGTSRNYYNGIVQFLYGYDNYEPRQLQPQKIGNRTVNFFMDYRSVAETLNMQVENNI